MWLCFDYICFAHVLMPSLRLFCFYSSFERIFYFTFAFGCVLLEVGCDYQLEHVSIYLVFHQKNVLVILVIHYIFLLYIFYFSAVLFCLVLHGATKAKVEKRVLYAIVRIFVENVINKYWGNFSNVRANKMLYTHFYLIRVNI